MIGTGYYRLLALDMDGTLLDTQKRISDRNRAAIARAADNGIETVISTGRALCQMTGYLDVLPEIKYILLASGAAIYDRCKETTRILRALDGNTIMEILDRIRGMDIMIQLLMPRTAVIERRVIRRLDDYHMGSRKAIYPKQMMLTDDIRTFIADTAEPILKLNLHFRDADERSSALRLLKDMDLETAYSEITSLECSPSGVSKGTALCMLCEELGFSTDRMMAVGDSDNDLPMLEVAGWPVAMGNACSRVKDICRTIVADCDHDGCAEAIGQLLSYTGQ